MLARLFLIGVTALARLPNQQPTPSVVQTLLDVQPLSDEVSRLVVYSHPDGFEVQLVGQTVSQGSSDQGQLFGMTLRVWLLQEDGTALGQRSEPMHSRLILPFTQTETVHFNYQPVPPQELAGIVVSVNGVSVNGELYAREIKVNPAS